MFIHVLVVFICFYNLVLRREAGSASSAVPMVSKEEVGWNIFGF